MWFNYFGGHRRCRASAAKVESYSELLPLNDSNDSVFSHAGFFCLPICCLWNEAKFEMANNAVIETQEFSVMSITVA